MTANQLAKNCTDEYYITVYGYKYKYYADDLGDGWCLYIDKSYGQFIRYIDCQPTFNTVKQLENHLAVWLKIAKKDILLELKNIP